MAFNLSKEFVKRISSALVLVAGVFAILFSNINELFILLMLSFAVIGTSEYLKALKNIDIRPNFLFLYFNVFIVFSSFLLPITWLAEYYFFGLTVFYLSLAFLFKVLKSEKLPQNFLLCIFQLFWIVFPTFTSAFFVNLPKWQYLILFLGFIITFTDIFAYFGGKLLGKTKLAPQISPNKTIEGSVVGLIGGAGIGVLFSQLFGLLSLSNAIFYSLILALLSQAGDLIESKFKRVCKVKDTGQIMPGHGGILDRIDSFMIASPIFYLILYLRQTL